MTRKHKTRQDFEPEGEFVGQVVKIESEDVLHTEEATERELDKEPNLTFTSYGLVIKETEKRLTLASTIGNEKRDKLLREVSRIPKTLIISTVKLEEVK